MTPKLTIRSFTNDQYVLDKVFYTNFYKLRGFQDTERKPIVLDLGAHCGFFTFTALSLGAKKVYAFEPFTPNYKMLLANVGDNPIGSVIPYQLGVHVSNIAMTFGYPQLINRSYFDFSNVCNEYNVDSIEFCRCCMIPLDTILQYYVGEQVDIMKISICVAEMQTIAVSDFIKTNVANICGEIALDEAGQQKFQALLVSKGFKEVEFFPVEGEENRVLFQCSKTSLKEVFV